MWLFICVCPFTLEEPKTGELTRSLNAVQESRGQSSQELVLPNFIDLRLGKHIKGRCLELFSLQHRAERTTSPGSCPGGAAHLPSLVRCLRYLILGDSVTSMPNLLTETYLPHRNYKDILAQQAPTHKVSPPGLLQITSNLFRLVSACLSSTQLREETICGE